MKTRAALGGVPENGPDSRSDCWQGERGCAAFDSAGALRRKNRRRIGTV